MEALSRGANHSTFTDKSFKSVQYIKSLADYLSIPEEKYQVIKIDARKYLKAEYALSDFNRNLVIGGRYGVTRRNRKSIKQVIK